MNICKYVGMVLLTLWWGYIPPVFLPQKISRSYREKNYTIHIWILLLMGCMKLYKQWDKLPTSTGACRISSINSMGKGITSKEDRLGKGKKTTPSRMHGIPRLQGMTSWCHENMGVSENSGTPKSSILIGFSIFNPPLWDTKNLWKHPYDKK